MFTGQLHYRPVNLHLPWRFNTAIEVTKLKEVKPNYCSILRVLRLWRRLTQIVSFQTPVSLLVLPMLCLHPVIIGTHLHPSSTSGSLQGLGVPQLFDKLKVHRNLFWSKSRTLRFFKLTKLKLLNAVKLLWKPKAILGKIHTHVWSRPTPPNLSCMY